MASNTAEPEKKNRQLILVIAIALGFLILINVIAVYLLHVEHKLRQDERKVRTKDSVSVR